MDVAVAPVLPDRGSEGLRSERLLVRRVRDEDAASLAAYRSDPDVARYQGWETPMSLDQARRFVRGMADDHPDTPGEWSVRDRGTRDRRAHRGPRVAHTRRRPRIATIRITLRRESQGSGYATEALRLLVDRHKHRVIGECDPRNTAVARLLERVGMRREAHHVQSYWDGSGWTDEYVYAILAHEWRQSDR
jgi:aminoglycoside 6'-N-acetyltransferase